LRIHRYGRHVGRIQSTDSIDWIGRRGSENRIGLVCDWWRRRWRGSGLLAAIQEECHWLVDIRILKIWSRIKASTTETTTHLGNNYPTSPGRAEPAN
jgi:hypothetical protein